jgi:hypothetical protein
MDAIAQLMHGAGLTHLMTGGRAAPHVFISAMMSKQKRQQPPYSRDDVAPPFRYGKMDNPSEFIQARYGSDEVRPFNAVRAQKRRDEAMRQRVQKVAGIMAEEKVSAKQAAEIANAEEKQRQLVHSPEYWGLTWDDLEPRGIWYFTKDGLRFPPVQYIDPSTGAKHYALATIDDDADKQRHRFKMLFFKENDVPAHVKDVAAAGTVEEKRKRLGNIDLFGTTAVQKRKALQKRVPAPKPVPPPAAPKLTAAQADKIEHVIEETDAMKTERKYRAENPELYGDEPSPAVLARRAAEQKATQQKRADEKRAAAAAEEAAEKAMRADKDRLFISNMDLPAEAVVHMYNGELYAVMPDGKAYYADDFHKDVGKLAGYWDASTESITAPRRATIATTTIKKRT